MWIAINQAEFVCSIQFAFLFIVVCVLADQVFFRLMSSAHSTANFERRANNSSIRVVYEHPVTVHRPFNRSQLQPPTSIPVRLWLRKYSSTAHSKPLHFPSSKVGARQLAASLPHPGTWIPTPPRRPLSLASGPTPPGL